MMPAVPITKIPAGMRPWMYASPPRDLKTVEVWRAGWAEFRSSWCWFSWLLRKWVGTTDSDCKYIAACKICGIEPTAS